ncbi:MAG TPA: hypothetical protein ENL13_02665, partial [Thermoplasmatales archaeon]|nr:hypothetical protein [Thermoplasmatales archaeon]
MVDIEEFAKGKGFNLLEVTKSVDERSIKNNRPPETIDAAYVEKEGVVYLLKLSGTIERIGTKEYWEKIMEYKATEKYVAKI